MSHLLCKFFGSAAVLGFAWLLRKTLCGGGRAEEQLEGYLALFTALRRGIVYYRAPIGELLARCDRSVLAACMGQERSARVDSLSALAEQSVFLSHGLGDVVRDAARQLGRGYHDEQVKACDRYIALLTERLEIYKKQERERIQVTGTLIYTAAVGGILLLL